MGDPLRPYDDLHQPKLAVELWEQRADIDALVELQ
jgi:hypothetical protein